MANAHNTLAKAFNTNTEAFLQSMTGADAMIWVLRMALNDMLNNRIRTIDAETGEKQVDLAAYLTSYREHVGAEAAKKDAPVLLNGESDEPIVFGGDS